MISLEKSERFQNEFNEWTIKTAQVTNQKAKAQLENLLVELQRSVRKIDSTHNKIFTEHVFSDTVTDSRRDLLNLRQKIFKLLKENGQY